MAFGVCSRVLGLDEDYQVNTKITLVITKNPISGSKVGSRRGLKVSVTVLMQVLRTSGPLPTALAISQYQSDEPKGHQVGP